MDTDEHIDDLKRRASLAPRNSPERIALQKDLIHAMHEKSKYDARAKSTYDALNTRIGQAIGKAANLPAGLTKQTKGNYAESAKAIAKHAADEAANATISKGDATEALKELHKDQREQIDAQRDTASQLVRAAENTAQQQKSAEGVDSEHSAALDRARQVEEETSRNKLDIERRYAGDRNNPQRAAELRREDAKIEDAHGLVKALQSRIDVIEKPIKDARERLKEADVQASKFNKEIEETAKSMVSESAKNAQDVAAALVHERKGNFLPRFFGQTEEDNTIAQMARGTVKKKIKAKGAKERQQADREILADAGETAAPTEGDAHH